MVRKLNRVIKTLDTIGENLCKVGTFALIVWVIMAIFGLDDLALITVICGLTLGCSGMMVCAIARYVEIRKERIKSSLAYRNGRTQ